MGQNLSSHTAKVTSVECAKNTSTQETNTDTTTTTTTTTVASEPVTISEIVTTESELPSSPISNVTSFDFPATSFDFNVTSFDFPALTLTPEERFRLDFQRKKATTGIAFRKLNLDCDSLMRFLSKSKNEQCLNSRDQFWLQLDKTLEMSVDKDKYLLNKQMSKTTFEKK